MPYLILAALALGLGAWLLFLEPWLATHALYAHRNGTWQPQAQGIALLTALWPFLLASAVITLPLGAALGWLSGWTSSKAAYRVKANRAAYEDVQKRIDADRAYAEYPALQAELKRCQTRLEALETLSDRELAVTAAEQRLHESQQQLKTRSAALKQRETALEQAQQTREQHWRHWAQERVDTAQASAEEAERRRRNAAATAERLRRKLKKHAESAPEPFSGDKTV